jgi:hypothetical protein
MDGVLGFLVVGGVVAENADVAQPLELVGAGAPGIDERPVLEAVRLSVRCDELLTGVCLHQLRRDVPRRLDALHLGLGAGTLGLAHGALELGLERGDLGLEGSVVLGRDGLRSALGCCLFGHRRSPSVGPRNRSTTTGQHFAVVRLLQLHSSGVGLLG